MARPLCVRLCTGPSSATLARRILRDGPPRNDEHTVCQVAVSLSVANDQASLPIAYQGRKARACENAR